MQLSLASVSIGVPKPPREWSNEKKTYIDLDAKEVFLSRLDDRKIDWKTKEVSQTLFYQDTTIGENAQVYHKNMLEYMEACWRDHLGLTITPDMFWYTLLCELSVVIKADAKKYRHLFSNSEESQDLIVVTEDPIRMPVDKMIALLSKKVPTNIDVFIPEFSTSTLRSKHAMNVAFCDMCSPFYQYGMFCCGIPAVDVQGTIEDYALMKLKWDELSKIFNDPSLESWFNKVSETFQSILYNFNSSEFWLKIFHLERCGSGSDEELEGWITNFFKDIPEIRYIRNYTTGVSVMDYENINTKKKYKMQEGLFFSRMEGDFLVPQFGFTIHEIVEEI